MAELDRQLRGAFCKLRAKMGVGYRNRPENEEDAWPDQWVGIGLRTDRQKKGGQWKNPGWRVGYVTEEADGKVQYME
jgi:hypothetical protein